MNTIIKIRINHVINPVPVFKLNDAINSTIINIKLILNIDGSLPYNLFIMTNNKIHANSDHNRNVLL